MAQVHRLPTQNPGTARADLRVLRSRHLGESAGRGGNSGHQAAAGAAAATWPGGSRAAGSAATLAAPGRGEGSAPAPRSRSRRRRHGVRRAQSQLPGGGGGAAPRPGLPPGVRPPPRELRPGGPELLLARVLSAALAGPLSQQFLKQHLCAQFFRLCSPCYTGALLLR